MQGNYQGNPPYVITPLEGISSYTPYVTLVPGCADIACEHSDGFADAVKAAASADYTILFVGLDQYQVFKMNLLCAVLVLCCVVLC